MEMSDLNGSWDIRLDFLQGEARHSAQLELEGEELKGRYRSQYGEQEIHGRVQGDAVEMRVGIHYQACGCSYGFKGKVEGDVIRGKVDMGEYWTGSWEARKVS
jgi:D-glucosaminate-6-phosphate ammonia-lyase